MCSYVGICADVHLDTGALYLPGVAWGPELLSASQCIQIQLCQLPSAFSCLHPARLPGDARGAGSSAKHVRLTFSPRPQMRCAAASARNCKGSGAMARLSASRLDHGAHNLLPLHALNTLELRRAPPPRPAASRIPPQMHQQCFTCLLPAPSFRVFWFDPCNGGHHTMDVNRSSFSRSVYVFDACYLPLQHFMPTVQ